MLNCETKESLTFARTRARAIRVRAVCRIRAGVRRVKLYVRRIRIVRFAHLELQACLWLIWSSDPGCVSY